MTFFPVGRLLALLALTGGPLAAAQVGYPLESTLAGPLAPLNLTAAPNGDRLAADGTRFQLETRGKYLIRASALLPGHDYAQAGRALGLLTGFGERISGPFAQYLTQNSARLAAGISLPAEQYSLFVKQAAGRLSFTVSLSEVPENRFDPGAHVIGNPKAKVVVREFSDFQCPYCRQFSTQTLPTLLAQLPPDVRLEYHHFPLEQIHPDARPAAEAAECAGRQGKFQPFHDALFADGAWIGTGDTPGALERVASGVGLDLTAYRACVTARLGKAAVDAGLKEGERVGVPGTPTLFVNGYLVPDPYDPNDILRLIDLARTE